MQFWGGGWPSYKQRHTILRKLSRFYAQNLRIGLGRIAAKWLRRSLPHWRHKAGGAFSLTERTASAARRHGHGPGGQGIGGKPCLWVILLPADVAEACSQELAMMSGQPIPVNTGEGSKTLALNRISDSRRYCCQSIIWSVPGVRQFVLLF